MGKFKKVFVIIVSTLLILGIIGTFINFRIYEFTGYRPLGSCHKEVNSQYASASYADQSLQKLQEVAPPGIVENKFGADVFTSSIEPDGIHIQNLVFSENYDDTITFWMRFDGDSQVWNVTAGFFSCYPPNVKIKKQYQDLLIRFGFDQEAVRENPIDINRVSAGGFM